MVASKTSTLAVVLAITASTLSAHAAPPTREGLVRCGPNAVYILSNLVGRKTTAGEIDGLLEPGIRGCSILELKQAMIALDQPAEVVRSAIPEIAGALPAIAHLERDISEPMGHFVVLTRFDADGLHYIDGTTGRTGVYAPERFQRLWSGNLLVLTRNARQSVAVPAAVTSIIFWMSIGWLLWSRRSLRNDSRTKEAVTS